MNTRLAAIAVAIASCLHTSVALCQNEVAVIEAASGKPQLALEIQTDPQATGSVFRISRSALKAAGYELRAIDAPQSGDLSPSKTRSIVAASVMSLGFAGVFLLRNKRRTAIATGLVAAILVGTFGMQAWGNGAPPPSYQPKPITLPGQQPQFQPGAAFNGSKFIGSGTIQTAPGANQFQQPVFGGYNVTGQPTNPLPIVNPAANPLASPVVNPTGNPIANPLTNPLANPLTVPTALPAPTVPVSSNFTNLLEMKPGAGGVSLQKNTTPLQGILGAQQRYNGTATIEVTDDDAGLRLVIGTKPVQPSAQIETPKSGDAGGVAPITK